MNHLLYLLPTLGIPLLVILVISRKIAHKPFRHHSATVLVLGDFGRSPRMMYHAQSLASYDWETVVVGYGDTTPIPTLLALPHVHLRYLSNPPNLLLRLPWVARAAVRVIYQIWSTLKICLWDVPVHTEVLLVQNPPSIPTLALAQIVAWVSGAKLIIDWHNTGYSILAMRVGEDSLLVRIAKWFEAKYGRKAYAHLFVTRALQEYLVKEWNLKGQTAVLHDRPPAHFKRTPPMAQHELFSRLTPLILPPPSLSFLPGTPPPTLFTVPTASGFPNLSPSRPALVVSSTSWTADEDFTPVFTALDTYQTRLCSDPSLPRLMVIITGKGDLRSAFQRKVAEREKSTWTDICARCLFLSAEDYPVLLGCADVGISMHSSSSGRDLPMKVVDMFGCGVPVLAKGFPAVDELVKDGVNGRVWESGQELGQQLVECLSGFPESKQLARLTESLTRSLDDTSRGRGGARRRKTILADTTAEEEWSNWPDNWDRVMHRCLLEPRHDSPL